MAGKIILNLMENEYTDSFSPTSDNNDSELWQLQAQEKLLSLLTEAGNQAKSYKRVYEKEGAKSRSSYHHAICISGDRGAGKTVFLRSAEQMWKANHKNTNTYPNLHFTEVVDPTLLAINDRFSDVIIATVYTAVDKSLQQSDISIDDKNKFYQSLRQLADSLGNACEYAELTGVDRILKYSSGIHIEEYFHQFLAASVKLLRCDAIVIAIDDVDMKTHNAFEVLDDIRRLLGCPLVIPIVSGDHDLYAHLCNMKFEESLTKTTYSRNLRMVGIDTAKKLSSAYLTKVFPNNSRLPLLPISDLLSDLTIQYGKEKEDMETYSDYEQHIKKYFYAYCNGQERSTDWPKPKNARDVTQLVRMLPPQNLKNLDSKNNENLWRTFKIWAEDKQDGAAYCNAESYLQLINLNSLEDFSLAKIISFNPKLQIDRRHAWAEKEFYEQQMQRMDKLNKVASSNKAPSQNKDTNRGVFDSIFDEPKKILRSMPPLEYITSSMYVTKDKVKSESKIGNRKILLSIFTHHDYYNTSPNQRYHIFCSRAFEILAWSMLAVTGNIVVQNKDKENGFKNIINRVFKTPPFYSIFAVNPTKMIDEEDDDNPATDSDEENLDNESGILVFTAQVTIWLANNQQYLTEFNHENMLPLISSIFNKVFTQIDILRLDKDYPKNFSNEHLSDLAKRFEYMFINALASFLRVGDVVNTNIAMDAKTETIRDKKSFLKNKSNTLNKNLLGLIDDSGKAIPKSEDEQDYSIAKLIEVMWSHPIFKLDLNDNVYRLGEEVKEISKKTEKTIMINNEIEEMSFNGLIEYYKSRDVNSGARMSKYKVTQWASNNTDEANKIYKRIEKLIVDQKIKKQLKNTRTNEYKLHSGLKEARGIGKS